MIDWYKKVVFENYANFNGRARRSEYWYFVLCNFLITMCLYIPMIISMGVSGEQQPGALFYLFFALIMIYSLAILVPSLAVAVRRLHDTGRSGWFYFVGLIPLVGSILLLVWFFTEGQRGTNEYGPDPKEV
ncbi:DUF805 domain-containing protein [Paenimyroides aestuarii]|uniref:DUF805 domain-containing protein n=1 Tax=Paenimyroides aestuarii TaxID=2968490 RepID=A0ABY5NP29_9FLAO|nr:DUF805 domain-containing protein [Paenimyroides aestuarii]UUV20254.1 DUF805 domain-containing protein [Paenimyroides aestuarii]